MVLELHRIEPATVGRWEEGFATWPVVINVPTGLEGACAGIARREGRLRLKALCPGFLVASKTEPARLTQAMQSAPIWSFGSFVLACTVRASDVASGRAITEATAALNAVIEETGLVGQPYWLNCPESESRAARKLLAQLLETQKLSIRNNPSDYRLTLRLASDGAKVYVLIGPSISVKERFAYRRRDVGASINPVLAAAMVRLAPPVASGLALDPTCGSGTLLAERLAYSNEDTALGIDLSTTAGEAFKANLSCGPSAGRFRFLMADGADPANWQLCQTVLANLPFGIRVRVPRADLEALYLNILTNAATFLMPQGRVILTSAFKSGLDLAINRIGEHLRVLSRYRAEMGGLFYQIVVAEKV